MNKFSPTRTKNTKRKKLRSPKILFRTIMKYPVASMMLIISMVVTQVFVSSCHKNEPLIIPVSLTVDLPLCTMHNGRYYTLNAGTHSIQLEFSQPVQASTVKGNISFYDKSSVFDHEIDIIVIDQMVTLIFPESIKLKSGWRYLIKISPGLKSTSGLSVASPTIIDLRTPALSLHDYGDTNNRHAILCVSDIHMGDQRSVDYHYGWFYKNASALNSFLDLVKSSHRVKQMVVLGDLFDAWIIPYSFSPFDSNVHDIQGYFESVSHSATNSSIINKLNDIASSSEIQLIYTPGNHDMLLSQDILKDIIPNIIFKETVPGIGEYVPLDGIIMEHGHRFDFFNGPQPLVNAGHMMPPGFFVSRLQAEFSKTNKGSMVKSASNIEQPDIFLFSWQMALKNLKLIYNNYVNEDSVNIIMNGLDGYSKMFSYNSARDMYNSNILKKWDSTQIGNMVPVPLSAITGILDSQDDLFHTIGVEYFSDLSPKKYNIAVLGHTHIPEIKVFPAGSNYNAIYANTGSWVNNDLGPNKTRTFILIWPGEWTGSDLDIVSLYQYNLDSENGIPGNGWTPVLLSEESIIRTR